MVQIDVKQTEEEIMPSKQSVKMEVDETKKIKEEGRESVEKEILKEERKNDVDSEYIEEEEDMKKIKVEVYCLVCQIYGHDSSEECVVNAKCFACGIKGHVRRDCKEEKYQLKNVKFEGKSENIKWEIKDAKTEVKREAIECEEEEYVELEVDKGELKTEINKECNSKIIEHDLEENINSYSSKSKDNIEKEFNGFNVSFVNDKIPQSIILQNYPYFTLVIILTSVFHDWKI